MNYVNGSAGQPDYTQAAPAMATGLQPKPTTIPDVYRAICQVTKALSKDGIGKCGKNEQQGYRFRGIDDIYNGLSAPIAEAELCVLPRMISRTQEERVSEKGKPLFSVVVEAEFDFVSARDGSKHTVAMFGEAMDSADKATNKAMSAAYKYAMQEVFCIPTEGMADADASTPAPAAKPKQEIDTGGHPMNTQDAADYVAQQKIAQGKVEAAARVVPVPAKRWQTRGEMKRCFAAVREEVGEYDYLGELGKFGARSTDDLLGSPKKAEECYVNLLGIARGKGKVA